MKLSDFIVPMSRYEYNENDVEVEISDNLQDLFNFSTPVHDYITSSFTTLYNTYARLGYRIIPMDITSDIIADRRKLSDAFCLKLYRRGELFKLFENVDGAIRLANLSAYEDTSSTETGHSEYINNLDKSYGKVITKSDDKNERTMGENAPIDADIETISSPNVKGKFITSNTYVDAHSGSDVDSGDGSTDNSNTVERKNKNPDVFSKYIQIISHTNIPHIIDEVLREFIWEFNEIR